MVPALLHSGCPDENSSSNFWTMQHFVILSVFLCYQDRYCTILHIICIWLICFVPNWVPAPPSQPVTLCCMLLSDSQRGVQVPPRVFGGWFHTGPQLNEKQFNHFKTNVILWLFQNSECNKLTRRCMHCDNFVNNCEKYLNESRKKCLLLWGSLAQKPSVPAEDPCRILIISIWFQGLISQSEIILMELKGSYFWV